MRVIKGCGALLAPVFTRNHPQVALQATFFALIEDHHVQALKEVSQVGGVQRKSVIKIRGTQGKVPS